MAQTIATRFSSTELVLQQGDITRIPVDAIVNAANSALQGGGGVDGAIHAGAGPDLLRELGERYPRGTPTGTAVITRAYRLPAKHVIHAVGPVWRGGSFGEAEMLASAYCVSLDLAANAGAAAVTFPAISCGVYAYPLDQAASVALTAVRDWVAAHPNAGPERITFVLRGDEIQRAFSEALEALQAGDRSDALGG